MGSCSLLHLGGNAQPAFLLNMYDSLNTEQTLCRCDAIRCANMSVANCHHSSHHDDSAVALQQFFECTELLWPEPISLNLGRPSLFLLLTFEVLLVVLIARLQGGLCFAIDTER